VVGQYPGAIDCDSDWTGYIPALTMAVLSLVATTARLLLLVLANFLAYTSCDLQQFVVTLVFVGIRQQAIPVVRVDVEEHRTAKM